MWHAALPRTQLASRKRSEINTPMGTQRRHVALPPSFDGFKARHTGTCLYCLDDIELDQVIVRTTRRGLTGYSHMDCRIREITPP
jgi:hypothetical protein